jgi:MoxR-like ATPase
VRAEHDGASGALGTATHGPGEAFWKSLQAAVGGAVVGAEPALRLLAVTLLAEGHALIEDVPGVGKTLLGRAFARALGLDFARVQGTPDLLPGDVTGSSVYEAGTFRFIPGPVFTNVLLFDEVNRATPRTQSALLEAMQEQQVSIEGETRALPRPFLVLATENPIELEGTFALPEAQLDRFLTRVALGYPDEEGERAIARRYRDAADPLDEVPIISGAQAILELQATVRSVRVAEDLERYIVGLTRTSRSHPALRLGASPRSSVALYRAAQAWAYLSGREFVLPDDIVVLAPAALGHRLLLDVDRQLRGVTVEGIIAELLEAVPLPVGEGP